MTTTVHEAAAAAAEYDVPIPYMQRTRDYYVALGYGTPYRWAHFGDVPFAPLRIPLSRARVALITPAPPYQREAGGRRAGAPYHAGATFYTGHPHPTPRPPHLQISHARHERTPPSA